MVEEALENEEEVVFGMVRELTLHILPRHRHVWCDHTRLVSYKDIGAGGRIVLSSLACDDEGGSVLYAKSSTASRSSASVSLSESILYIFFFQEKVYA